MGPKKAGGKKAGGKKADAAKTSAGAPPDGDAAVGPPGGKSGAARAGGKKAGGKKGGKDAPAPPTPEEACARLWRCLRGMSGRREVGGLWAEYKAKQMEEMKRKMWLEHAKAERKKDEAERKAQKEKKEKEERIRKNREAMFEAAFDGEVELMADLVEKQGVSIHITDAHDNTPVGEAAVAGQTECVRWLIERGADPNVKGAYDRTPLFRAAFNSHTETCQLLLEHGGDPRMQSQSEMPVDVASGKCKELLQGWDISKSEELIKKLDRAREEREAARKAEAEAIAESLEGDVGALEEVYKNASRAYTKSKQSLEERIFEYDRLTRTSEGVGKDPALIEACLQALHDAEGTKENTKEALDEAQDKLYQARLKLRVHQKKELGESEPGVEIKIKMLPEVAITDVGGKIAAEGKWPFVIDYSGQARVFLQYRDTNMINACHAHAMEPERLRIALLGGIRYGKPMVVDLMDVDIIDHVKEQFNKIEAGLWDKILDRSIVKDDAFFSLIRKEDGDAYRKQEFIAESVDKFRFIVLCASRLPPDELLTQMYVLRIDFGDID